MDPYFKQLWEAKRLRNEKLIKDGMVYLEVKKTKRGDKLVVTAPYHPRFNEKAKAFGASWKWKSKTWIFKGCPYDEILELARQIYGRESVIA